LGQRLCPEAIVVQQDRNLVMGQQTELDLDDAGELEAAYATIASHRPLPLGRYLLRRNGDPLLWTYQAVVHDLDLNPSCRPGDVRRSLIAILEDALRRKVTTIACEPLGSFRNVGIDFEEMVEAFDAAIVEVCVERLQTPLRLTLLLPGVEALEQVSHLLRSRILRRASRSFRTVNDDAAVVEVRQSGSRLHYRFVPGTLSGYMVTRVGDVA
jgi:hypothetical protein